MSDIREIANPSDKITIDCSDLEAARVAVTLLGQGWYKIVGDDDMPILALGGADSFAQETYGKSWEKLTDDLSNERLASVLESVSLVGERSSTNNIVGSAHRYAKRLRELEKTK